MARRSVDESEPQAAASHGIAVAEVVTGYPLLLVVDAVRTTQILNTVLAIGPDDARMVARHHCVVSADRALDRTSDQGRMLTEVHLAFVPLGISPQYARHLLIFKRSRPDGQVPWAQDRLRMPNRSHRSGLGGVVPAW
jgi:hypothetical protein